MSEAAAAKLRVAKMGRPVPLNRANVAVPIHSPAIPAASMGSSWR